MFLSAIRGCVNLYFSHGQKFSYVGLIQSMSFVTVIRLSLKQHSMLISDLNGDHPVNIDGPVIAEQKIPVDKQIPSCVT